MAMRKPSSKMPLGFGMVAICYHCPDSSTNADLQQFAKGIKGGNLTVA
jgi:hypothetical protein